MARRVRGKDKQVQSISFSMEHAKVGEEMEQVTDFILEGEWTEKHQMAAVAFEEAFVNICVHAYEGRVPTGPVRVVVEKDEEAVTIHIFDRGVFFDSSKEEIKPIENLQVGGHGLRLMREYSKMSYESVNGENHLTMVICND